MPPPRDPDENVWMYAAREYVLPGLVFFFMIKWLIMEVAVPMVQGRLKPQKVKRNVIDDNELLEPPAHAKME